tara:strand:- start:81 stop:500 length:420 start_codon:yes stop_codon:yes gene_type:complete
MGKLPTPRDISKFGEPVNRNRERSERKRVVAYLIHPEAFVDVYSREFIERHDQSWVNESRILARRYHVKDTIRLDEGNYNIRWYAGTTWIQANFRGCGIHAELQEQVASKLIEPVEVEYSVSMRKPGGTWQEILAKERD